MFALSVAYPAKTFDTNAMESGILRTVKDNYGVSISDVSYPDNLPVRVGAIYMCTSTISDQPVTVRVQVTSSAGGYEVYKPI